MKKKIKFFLFFIFISKNIFANQLYSDIQPEPASIKTNLKKSLVAKDFIVVTANDYATSIGFEILSEGGNAVDAAVAIQMTLGLVEPQSSGLGGGSFITFYNKSEEKVYSYEGREKAPKKIPGNIFLNNNGDTKKFFEAAIGGAAVGTPATLKTYKLIHSNYGLMNWEKIISYVIEFSKNGFIPSARLINAINKERFFFDIYPNSIFKNIITDPKKKFYNDDYTETLKLISKKPSVFYEGIIADNIVKEVQKSKNSGYLNKNDLELYEPEKNYALCHKLKNNKSICGPNLPSSGTICIIQALIIYESISKETDSFNINSVLSILDFVYSLRSETLADDKFEDVDINLLLNEEKLLKKYKNFLKINKKTSLLHLDEILNSTTHFSIVDKDGNIVSATSSIESSFGSRLFTNGFFLNNQLTDFSFKMKNSVGDFIKNRVVGGKRPLSSMSPIIVFNENGELVLTIGSPGGKAIIAYVFRVLIETLYNKIDLEKSLNNPNYLRIKGRTFLEDKSLKKNLIGSADIRNLTSGLAVIYKTKDGYLGVADKRRDGTVMGN